MLTYSATDFLHDEEAITAWLQKLATEGVVPILPGELDGSLPLASFLTVGSGAGATNLLRTVALDE
jgi:hypothetical protein